MIDHTTTNRPHRSDGCPASRGHRGAEGPDTAGERPSGRQPHGSAGPRLGQRRLWRPRPSTEGAGRPCRIPDEDGAGDMAEAPLLGEDGGIPDAIGQALKKAMKVLKALEAV